MTHILEKGPAFWYTLGMPRKSSAPNNLKRSPFNVREIVGGNIKRHRLTLGLSQQELADRFGVSRAAVSQYEIGTGEVNAGDLPRLADLLGISLLDFFAGSGPSLNPTDRQSTEHAEGSWTVEPADVLPKTHEPFASQQRGRPRDTRHRRPASLAYALGTPGEELLGKVDIAEEVVKLKGGGEIEVRKEARTSERQAGKVQAGEADQESVNESESNAGSSAGPLFFRDHQFRVAHYIVPALQQDRSREAVARLAELAGDFLSLSRRDQETLSRVAEALKAQTQQERIEEL